MPRYFFHVSHDQQGHDDEGLELSGLKDAWREATLACADLIREIDGDLAVGSDWRMDVEDDAGRKLFSIHFGAERTSPKSRADPEESGLVVAR